jgi:hypothetical protein
MTTSVKAKPILFSGPMVRAILDGRKTQTRRVVKPQPWDNAFGGNGSRPIWGQGRPRCLGGNTYAIHARFGSEDKWLRSPYGGDGDRLWVRETWADADCMYQSHVNDVPGTIGYFADKSAIQFNAKSPRQIGAIDLASWNWNALKRRPSIFMPRWASRITLEITSIRVERLQEISEADAIAEGVQCDPTFPAALTNRTAFGKGWNTLNAKRGYSWESNPWVWVIEFRKME